MYMLVTNIVKTLLWDTSIKGGGGDTNVCPGKINAYIIFVLYYLYSCIKGHLYLGDTSPCLEGVPLMEVLHCIKEGCLLWEGESGLLQDAST